MRSSATLSHRHPQNARGDFYSECLQAEECNRCFLPQIEAPSLVTYLINGDKCAGQCIFKRQPQTREECSQAVKAIEMACCDSLRYGGSDPQIIAWLEGFNCDNT